MTIFDFLFSCFRFIINILDTDFFGLGFSYLDFMLAASLGLLIINFLLKGFNDFDRFNFLSITNGAYDLNRKTNISNRTREKQVSKIRSSGYVGSDKIDVWGDGTYIVSKDKFYGKD